MKFKKFEIKVGKMYKTLSVNSFFRIDINSGKYLTKLLPVEFNEGEIIFVVKIMPNVRIDGFYMKDTENRFIAMNKDGFLFGDHTSAFHYWFKELI